MFRNFNVEAGLLDMIVGSDNSSGKGTANEVKESSI